MLTLEKDKESEEKEDILLLHYSSMRKPTSDIFKSQENKGINKILISNHFIDKEI